jgi:ABC-type multidrug transport system permease subunit
MKALILGIIILAASVFTGFRWWNDVLAFLRGALPVIAAFIGLIAVFIGIADIKDRAEAKKEETAGEKTE